MSSAWHSSHHFETHDAEKKHLINFCKMIPWLFFGFFLFSGVALNTTIVKHWMSIWKLKPKRIFRANQTVIVLLFCCYKLKWMFGLALKSNNRFSISRESAVRSFLFVDAIFFPALAEASFQRMLSSEQPLLWRIFSFAYFNRSNQNGLRKNTGIKS